MTRTLSRAGITVALLLPVFVFAAYNDVSLTTSATFSVNSITINVTGSTAVVESVTVGATTLTVVLQPNSYFKISAPNLNRFSLTTTGKTVGEVPVCTGSESSLQLTPSDEGQSTVVITPSAALCAAASSSSGSTTGGGAPVGLLGQSGGGGGSAPAAVLPATSSAQSPQSQTLSYSSGLSGTQIDAILSLLSSFGADQVVIDNVKSALSGKATTGTVTAAFARNLELGMTGEDVKALQQWLNANGYRVAESGPGSSGNETTKFGTATKAALIKFQKAKGISPAAGYFGPKTRAAIGQ